MDKHTSHYTFTFLYIILMGIIIFGCQPQDRNDTNHVWQTLTKPRVMLPNGWSLTPPLQSMPLDELPLNLQVSASGNLAAVTNNGYGQHSVMLFDTKSEKLLDRQPLDKAWYGLKFSPDEHYLFVAGGHDNLIYQFQIVQDHLEIYDTIKLGLRWPTKIGPAGIDIDSEGKNLFVVTREDRALYKIELSTKKIAKIPLPAEAYACLVNGQNLYISLWGAGSVAVVDLDEMAIKTLIAVGSHPNELLLSGDQKLLYVANANDNTVSVIQCEQAAVIETIGTALKPDAPAGSTPNGLAMSTDGKTLYIANADNNCLAVFDVEQPASSRSIGFIPTGWYPTSVKIIHDKLWVTNGKGEQSMPNSNGPNPYKHMTDSTAYSGRMFKGSLSIIQEPRADALKSLTAMVYDNTPFVKEQKIPSANHVIPGDGKASEIKYIFYVIKENRTYDQVFGDLPSGNGDSTLCLFGKDITPNHHKLATEFTLFDNFYVDAEVSADGHNWSMAAYATDYTEKSWPTSYGGKGGTYDYEGSRNIAFPRDGYIWDYCQRKGISYRSYGEFIHAGKTNMDALKGHYDPDFVGFNLHFMDTLRFHIWQQDFDSLLAGGNVPRLNIIRLPNDHTSGAKLGSLSPRSQVADNDLALGMLVDYLSHSPIWHQSAIFVLEDDAQNGPDHVDAHRSVLLAISPYTKRHFTDHTLYSTSSVLRTMELILGLPAMSQYDAGAQPLYASFTGKADLTPYRSLSNKYPLDERNTNKKLALQSATFDLDTEDAADDIALNKVIWQTVKGEGSPMPAPRHSAFVFTTDDDDDNNSR